jgi:hypothetical protein
MLCTLFVILLIMWALGLVTSYTFGRFVHILWVMAMVVCRPSISLTGGEPGGPFRLLEQRKDPLCVSIR